MMTTGFAMAASERQLLESKMQALRDPVVAGAPDACFDELAALRRQSDRLTDAVRHELFAARLVADESDNGAIRWICAQQLRMARLARRIAEAIAKSSGAGTDRWVEACAIALHYMAESVKGEIAAGFKDSHHHGRVHSLMKAAMSAGRHRDPFTFEIGGQGAQMTIEMLYLRAMLLARISTGGLTLRQVEIFDAYFLHHNEVLMGQDAAPADFTWRADVDASTGLRAGVRKEVGVSIYLPLQPLEEAFRAIVREFHAGRIFPATGIVSEFPVEDHVAVLDLMRRRLRQSRRAPIGRAKRHPVDAIVEVHVGLSAIVAKGFVRQRRPIAAMIATIDGVRAPVRRPGEYGHAAGTLVPNAANALRLVNISHTGVGLEGSETQCANIAAGDLIGVQMHDGEPLVVAKIVRRVVSPEGRVTLGAQRISSAARVVACELVGGRGASVSLLYVPGNERAGNRDVYVAPESIATGSQEYTTRAAGNAFTFRFNRVREHGRGWVLAGFEVLAAEREAA